MQALREKGALTYHVGASLWLARDAATYDIETQVAPETLLTALRVLDVELARLRDALLSSDELALAKLQVRERFAQRLEEHDSLAELLGSRFALYGRAFADAPAAALQRELAAYESVTSEQLRDVARRYLQPAQRAVAIAGPLQEFEFELARWYDGHIDIFVPKRLVHHFE